MFYEFHRYELLPGKTDEYEELFGRIPFKVWQKSGAQILGVWRTVEEEPEALCYLVAYRDRAHRDECFTWVRQNPELEAYHRAGTFVAGRTRHMLQPAPYSPAQ